MLNPDTPCPGIKLIRVPIYRQPVYVVFTVAEWRRIEEWHKFDTAHLGVGCTATRFDDNKSMFIIGVFDDSIDTLAHEVFHLTGMIMHRANVYACWDNDEAAAYLHGHLFSEVYEAFMNNRKLQYSDCGVV